MKVVDVRDKLPTHNSKKYPIRPLSAIYYIAVHHSLTDNIPGGEDICAFARYHVNNLDWPGIGYHYVIDTDGTVYKTNAAKTKSYHVGKHNQSALGVCLVGDFRDYDPTDKQYQALVELLKTLQDAYGITTENIKGHSEFEGYKWKKCPEINMDRLRKEVK